ncbi:Calpain [Hondaea fermentalgiana]|uniref:Calpain n=1 Tax=Hondaea fermentalgiana TaxID=2315210 RepID=A0A2R5GUA0_9STRA|nr:Calpain [Hondaea fermentalgiana]|eukprot:GBG34446.1 Calpain [Hondaea fermentalgiana]
MDASEESAVAAERELVARLGSGERFCDPWTTPGTAAADALYHDCTVLPPGACAPELVRWCSIHNGNEIEGCFAPKLLPNPDSSWSPLRQGRLANAWWLNAVSLLAASVAGRTALQKLFVSSAHAASHGIYSVRFWKRGAWTVIHVDDKVPCDPRGVPLFSRCLDPNEVWILVLEKAYAKLHGSYLNLENGRLVEALRDLTGGVAAWASLNDWFDFAARVPSLPINDGNDPASEKKASTLVFGARISPEGLADGGPRKRSDGLRAGWIYSVQGAFQSDCGKVRLVGLREPWRAAFWRGPWSKLDRATWHAHMDVKEALNPDDDIPEDAVYLPWDLFSSTFGQVLVCQLPTAETARTRFQGRFESSSLVCGAGGSPADEVNWLTNPMIAFTASEPACLSISFGQDEDARMDDFFSPSRDRGFVRTATQQRSDDDSDDEDTEVAQDKSFAISMPSRDTSGLGLIVLKVGNKDSGRQRATGFQESRMVGNSGEQYRTDREVGCFCRLTAGDYVIVPSTFASNVQGEFVIDCLVDLPAAITFAQDPAKPLQDQLKESDGGDVSDDDVETKGGADGSSRAQATRGKTSKLVFQADPNLSRHDDMVSHRDLELRALQDLMHGQALV